MGQIFSDSNIIEHAVGTTKCKHGNYQSWIKYWKRYSGEAVPDNCPFQHDGVPCTNEARLGAHVHGYPGVYENNLRPTYIVPSCYTCNNYKWQEKNGLRMAVDLSLLLLLPGCDCGVYSARTRHPIVTCLSRVFFVLGLLLVCYTILNYL